jgi:23S rRNA (cytosine1962-C5)-methyltransferase
MFSSDEYQLIDFGDGRKLERFAGVLVDRPAPQAVKPRGDPSSWQNADLRYAGGSTNSPNQQAWKGSAPEDWRLRHRLGVFHLQAAPSGQIGIFPEQAANWEWLDDQMARLEDEEPRILNLFGYSGASTIAVARRAAETVHIDAAKSVVDRARQNASLSGLVKRQIRWIVEDASRFVDREHRRQRLYHGIILDPPSFGRGPKGQLWRIREDLPPLLKLCRDLILPNGFLLLSCHTTGLPASEVRQWVDGCFSSRRVTRLASSALCLRTPNGASLDSGTAIRWSGETP